MCDAFSLFDDDLEVRDDDDDDNNNDDDTETPDPAQAQIPSHPGIKYLVRGIPPSDLFPGPGPGHWSEVWGKV